MLHETLKAARKAKGLSQEMLADRLHVVRQTVSKWEKGLSAPSAELLVCLARELDTTVEALLGSEGETAKLQEISARLEAMERQMADQAERRRRHWRRFFLCLGILALIAAALELAVFLHGFAAGAVLRGDSAVIGGGDAKTDIYVSKDFGGVGRLILILAGAAVAAVGFWKTRKR